MALAGLAGMLIGGIIALLIDRQRGGLRTAEQLEAATGLFPLGFVPRVRRGERGRIESQDTAYTRAVDHVRSLLRFGDMRYRAHVVLITSAAIAEGKSFFALSLAASIGREGGRALLIDMDVRRSGFADVTANRRGKRHAAEHPVANAGVRQLASITEDALPGVNIMRLVGANAGIMPPGWAADLGELIKDATAQYDLIVIDTPPVLALPDAAIMAKLVDGAIMVVRWRHTPVAAVTSALRTLNAYGVRLLGGVLTQVQLAEMGAAEGAHAHFHHRTARAYG
jgi:Mrp family chromosome partitioning ATPase